MVRTNRKWMENEVEMPLWRLWLSKRDPKHFINLTLRLSLNFLLSFFSKGWSNAISILVGLSVNGLPLDKQFVSGPKFEWVTIFGYNYGWQ